MTIPHHKETTARRNKYSQAQKKKTTPPQTPNKTNIKKKRQPLTSLLYTPHFPIHSVETTTTTIT
jgi:hypothetical protein